VDGDFGRLATDETMGQLLLRTRKLTQHWLKARVFGLLYEMYKARLEWGSAEYCARVLYALSDAIYPSCSSVSAWQREDVADAVIGALGAPPAVFLPAEYAQALHHMHNDDLRPRGEGFEAAQRRLADASLAKITGTARASHSSVSALALEEYLEAHRQMVIVYGASHGHVSGLREKIHAVATFLQLPPPDFGAERCPTDSLTGTSDREALSDQATLRPAASSGACLPCPRHAQGQAHVQVSCSSALGSAMIDLEELD